MPLRDHFRPPVSARHSWEGFHGGWPMTMVQNLFGKLPPGYTAEPRVHLGSYFEIDVTAFEEDAQPEPPGIAPEAGGVATLPWAPPHPTLTLDADVGEQYEYEVQVYDQAHGRRLVAAVEIVSPANKNRPDHRQLFVAKCAALLQKNVCVAIVDVVTVRRANLYAELLELIRRSDPAYGIEPPGIYAVTCRTRAVERKPRLESWAYTLELGQPLPTLPLWLAEDVVVALDLEASYEDTCRVLRIP
jgi:hypothetical protein